MDKWANFERRVARAINGLNKTNFFSLSISATKTTKVAGGKKGYQLHLNF